ncbi:DUF5333 domain-containing protein [Pseudooceanicola sp. CBS1P-1]|uniref:DUF5333 domain-containing protein n=2 Tax=Paracoccaceae TaxID=31989 RepID=A0A6L7FZH7_9RHOB|nr:DUF5333 domain-containing protein [Pseudooceanicola endophyticus]MXN17069.1 hypothetical protein [Pseudooceanicola albus]
MRHRRRWLRGAVLAGAVALAAPALAANPKLPLREVASLDRPMLWVGIAIEISNKCDSIDARTVKGLLFLNELKNQALAMGYTRTEIKEYITSKAEKARIRKLGESYVKSQGLDPTKTADLCTLGKQEIARGSQIGVLLREK